MTLGDGEGSLGALSTPWRGHLCGAGGGSRAGVTVTRAQELLQGLNLGARRAAVPALAVALALEGKASHRELTSRLLAELVARALAPEDIAWAFDKMLRDLPDLILDTPEAPQVRMGTGTGGGHGRAGDTLGGHAVLGAMAVPGVTWGPWLRCGGCGCARG